MTQHRRPTGKSQELDDGFYFRPNARNNNCGLQPFFDAVHYIKSTELLFEMWHLSRGFLLSYTRLHAGFTLAFPESNVLFASLFCSKKRGSVWSLQKGFFIFLLFFFFFVVVFLFKLTGFSAVSVSDFPPNYLLCAAWHTFPSKIFFTESSEGAIFGTLLKCGGVESWASCMHLHHAFARRPPVKRVKVMSQSTF